MEGGGGWRELPATFKASLLFLGEANPLGGKAHPEDGVPHQQGVWPRGLTGWGAASRGWQKLGRLLGRAGEGQG